MVWLRKQSHPLTDSDNPEVTQGDRTERRVCFVALGSLPGGRRTFRAFFCLSRGLDNPCANLGIRM